MTALNGDPKAGLATAGPAALRMEAESRKLEVAQVKTTGVKENAEMFGRALRTAHLAGDAEAGFHLAQVLIETDAGRAAAAAKARAAAGPLADALTRRQELTAQKIKLDDAFVAAGGDPAKAAAVKAQLAEVQAGIAESEAVLDRDFPNYRALTYPAPVAIEQAQARLDPGEALIVPVCTDEGLFVFALTREAVAWDRTPLDRRAVGVLVRRMRAGIDAGVGVRAAVDASGGTDARRAGFDRQAAFQLYQAIFTPKVRALTDRARVYTLATSDALSALPFAMLVTAPPKGEDADPAALRATPWLIRKAPIQVAPSIPAMRADVRKAAGGKTAFFGAGAPALSGGGYSAARGTLRGATVEAAAVKGLSALPGADVELHAMARALGADRSQVLTGAEATETAVKAAPLAEVRVVAFATHGLTAGELPGLLEPALVFTPRDQGGDDDALLTASEAAQLKLNADWVILSACNTAAGEDGRSPGYTGLARAFMLAGGDRVLASHWPVRDDAAARLTVDTVRAASHGATPAKALQKAMLALIDDRSVPGGPDPSVWAPFVLVGR
jgi:CHAT domain-containing protein